MEMPAEINKTMIYKKIIVYYTPVTSDGPIGAGDRAPASEKEQ
jgi:hypothetical protein